MEEAVRTTAVRLRDLPAPPAGRAGFPWTEESAAPGPTMPDGSAWPRISIVTPSYNQAQFLEETIRSVLLQGYPNLEYIVMDGGSTDASPEIIKKYSRWLAHWESTRDRGQTHAINKGLARATGEIFAYLNSDDVYVADAFAAVARGFAKSSRADVVFGQCIHINEDGTEIQTRQARFDGLDDYLRIWERLDKLESLTQPEVFCRLSTLRRVGEFREDLRFVMDFEMWIRMLKAGCVFEPIGQPVARFRVYQGQKSTSAGEETYKVIRETYDGLVRDHPERASKDFLDQLTEARVRWLWSASFAASRGGAVGQGLSLSLRTVRLRPRVLGRKRFWRALLDPAVRLVRGR